MAAVAPDAAFAALVVVAFLLSAVAVRRLSRPRGRWGATLRRRFVLGVPWGTLVVAGVVLGVYLFLQGGAAAWHDPTVIPFRAWSYFYPLGMLAAAFAHTGPSHLLGNLAGTLAFAPLCEFAWGHFPRERGSHSFGSARTNPLVRAFVLFPAVVLGVGVASALFAVGPVIGFSGVVFAFAGFALVRYPYATVLALLASRAAGTVRVALQDPVLVSKSRPVFVTPWWAQIAIQGHALGLLIGVLVGIGFLRTRAEGRPRPLRLWTAVLLFAMSQALWAVYWFRGGSRFVLYRGLGVALVAGLATLVTAAASSTDRGLAPWLDRLRPSPSPVLTLLAAGGAVALEVVRGGPAVTVAGVRVPVLVALAALLVALVALLATLRPALPNPVADVPRRQVALAALLVALAGLAGPAVPVNLLTVSDQPLPGEPTEIRDYEVTYAENVTSGMVSVIDVSAFGETTAVRTSGVIVRSERRGVWTTAVTTAGLAFDGNRTVRVGGVGWRESLVVNRTGWRVAGGGAAYRITFYDDSRRDVAFTSPRANASPTIATRNVSVAAGRERFWLVVTRRNATLGRTPLPRAGTARAGGLRFVRRNRTVYAERGGTRIAVARKERYE